MAHRVAVIGGDGIGPEVVAEALKVVEAAGIALGTEPYDLGARRYLATGELLPKSVLDELRDFDAILLGAVGSPEVAPGVLERGVLLALRFGLDLYVNLRPALWPASGLDVIIIREGTEGAYANAGGLLAANTANEVATQTSIDTRRGVERVVRYALRHAADLGRSLTLVHKTNVLEYSGGLWQRTFDDVAAEHGDVHVGYDHVDAACVHLVGDPSRYQMIVTDNLFGDILTDLAGALAGGIGLAPSANLNPERSGPSLFEPVHGSAPDIAGTGRANPVAAVLSATMMVEFLGEAEAAARIRKAVGDPAKLIGTTTEIGDTIAARV